MSFNHILLGVLVAAIWGTNFVAIKFSCDAFKPFTLVLIRFILTVFPLVFFLPRPKTPLRKVAGLSLFMWAGQFIPMFLAIYQGMRPGLTSLLMQSQVIMTTIWSVIFLRSRLTSLNILGLCVSSLGLVCIAFQTRQDIMVTGYMLVLLSAFSVSIGNMLMKTEPGENLLSMVCWSILLAIPLLLITTACIEGFDHLLPQIKNVSLKAGLAIVFTSYISSPVGFTIWAYLMRIYSPAAVSPFTLLVPVFGMGSCALVLEEKFTLPNIMASSLVGIGLMVNYAERLRRKNVLRQATTEPPSIDKAA